MLPFSQKQPRLTPEQTPPLPQPNTAQPNTAPELERACKCVIPFLKHGTHLRIAFTVGGGQDIVKVLSAGTRTFVLTQGNIYATPLDAPPISQHPDKMVTVHPLCNDIQAGLNLCEGQRRPFLGFTDCDATKDGNWVYLTTRCGMVVEILANELVTRTNACCVGTVRVIASQDDKGNDFRVLNCICFSSSLCACLFTQEEGSVVYMVSPFSMARLHPFLKRYAVLPDGPDITSLCLSPNADLMASVFTTKHFAVHKLCIVEEEDAFSYTHKGELKVMQEVYNSGQGPPSEEIRWKGNMCFDAEGNLLFMDSESRYIQALCPCNGVHPVHDRGFDDLYGPSQRLAINTDGDLVLFEPQNDGVIRGQALVYSRE